MRLSTLLGGLSIFGVLFLAPGCKNQPQNTAHESLSIFAAASLTDVMKPLAVAFEQRHPQLKVKLTFAGSQILRLQIEQGAHFDLFASADQKHIEKLREQELVEHPVPFAENQLVLIVPLDNPARLSSFLDLPLASHVVLAEESVPLGNYTRQLMARVSELADHENFAEAVGNRVVSRESNARLVRAKVELGEADAAIVYRSDAVPSKRVKSILIPEKLNVQARYFIGASSAAKTSSFTANFMRFLESPEALRVLKEYGFRAASDKHGVTP